MATAVYFGPPAPPSPHSQLSASSSPRSASASSSESPGTATSFTFSVRYPNALSPEDPGDDVIPKIEELDDDESVIDSKVEPVVNESNGTEPGQSTNGIVVRRPRGRPRKHPQSPAKSLSKSAKGRSKTGCITCRRRKKKCDETKPACLHCQKNNVHCEGYPPKDYWKPGKQFKKDRRMSVIERPRDLPQLIPAIENDVDWFFFEHFNMHLSRVLSLFTDRQNPFKGKLPPLVL